MFSFKTQQYIHTKKIQLRITIGKEKAKYFHGYRESISAGVGPHLLRLLSSSSIENLNELFVGLQLT